MNSTAMLTKIRQAWPARMFLVANLALARKLAEWFWRVMVKGVTYVEQGLAKYETQVLETKRRALQRLAKQLGRIVLPSSDELQRA